MESNFEEELDFVQEIMNIVRESEWGEKELDSAGFYMMRKSEWREKRLHLLQKGINMMSNPELYEKELDLAQESMDKIRKIISKHGLVTYKEVDDFTQEINRPELEGIRALAGKESCTT